MRSMAILGVSRSSLFLAAGLLAVTLDAACGGGDPASPTFTPTVTADDASSSSDDASSPATGTIPTDVEAVLSARCQTCHQDPPLNGAPFPLLTYADVHGLFDDTIPKYQEMHALIQPDGSPHMPFGTAPQLDATQFSTLDDWLVAGAPSGN
jgi:hypothetical protein